MLRQAIPSKDLPVILGVVTFTTIGILVLNLVVDLAYAMIDPRVRMAQESRARRPRSTRRTAPAPVADPAAT